MFSRGGNKMAKYTKMAEGVLKDVGGLENIKFVGLSRKVCK